MAPKVPSMRLAALLRQSDMTDETTSPERQTDGIQDWSDRRGHRIVLWDEDLDVSGKTDPLKRPGVKRLLARMDEWDALIVHKHDRMGRNLRHFLNFIYYLEQHGKHFISVEPEIDMTTEGGRLVANSLFSAAEYELAMITKRVTGATKYIKSNGGYPGGSVPFGYRPVKRVGAKGWTYEPDPVYAPIVREIVNRILGGTSMTQVCHWLNSEDIPTSRNLQIRRSNVRRIEDGKDPRPEKPSKWRVPQLKEILSSPAMYGAHVKHEKIDGKSGVAYKALRDEDGLTVQRCKGVIEKPEWLRLQKAITGPAHKPNNASPLLRVGFCGLDEHQLYPHDVTKHNVRGDSHTLRYFRCSSQTGGKADPCSLRRIPRDWLLAEAGRKFLEGFGDQERGHWEIEPAKDHARELAEVRDLIDELDAEYNAGGLNAKTYARQINRLEERREYLESLEVEPEKRTWMGTGETYGERWERLTEAERADEWRETGFRFYVVPTADGGFEVMGAGGRWPESLRPPAA